MALPSTGSISLNQVNVELGLSATAQISLNNAAVRGLFGVGSGAISMSNGYGKANAFAFTIASNQTNANLRTLAVNAGWNQSTAVLATINSGVVINGSVQGNSTAALTVDGSWPSGVTLINNGQILGRGGDGGQGGIVVGQVYNSGREGSPGATAGRALLVYVPLTLNNSGTIAGGGGGGGGGGAGFLESSGRRTYVASATGGGGGGGAGFGSGGPHGGTNSYANRDPQSYTQGLNGASGSINSAGGGGTGSSAISSGYVGVQGGSGGAGGSYGAAGNGGGTAYIIVGSANVVLNKVGGGGGASGQAIAGNSNITYTATGTRLGPIV